MNRAIAAILILTALLAASYFKGRHDEELSQAEKQRDALIAYAERIKQGETQHDEDQSIITKLAADNRRMRVHIPKCPASTNQDGEAGLFSARVDEEFGKLQEVAGNLFLRCDQLNIDAIRLNAAIAE